MQKSFTDSEKQRVIERGERRQGLREGRPWLTLRELMRLLA